MYVCIKSRRLMFRDVDLHVFMYWHIQAQIHTYIFTKNLHIRMRAWFTTNKVHKRNIFICMYICMHNLILWALTNLAPFIADCSWKLHLEKFQLPHQRPEKDLLNKSVWMRDFCGKSFHINILVYVCMYISW